jgi:chromate transporter
MRIGPSDQASPAKLDPHLDAVAPVSAAQAFWFWLKLGFVSFGGPAGQIALMHEELVTKRRWLSERRFLHALNYCMVLPGPEAQQLATYIGWLMHRTWGGVVAGALFVLPSLLLLIALSAVYVLFGSVPLVAGVLAGIKPAVTAIVVQAAYRIGSKVLKNRVLWGIAALAFVGMTALNLPFPLIILGAAAVGVVGASVAPQYFKTGGSHAASKASDGPAWIDDNTPPPAHARFSPRRLSLVIAAGLALWCLPMAAVVALQGTPSTLAQMAWFFTKAALLTFGGAYAVLPYVYQGAVSQFGWLTAPQMMDGLALGETTPGPLIMVVAFVGFLGGFGQSLTGDLMGLHPVMAGALAATWVTWFTFLPSFIFILAGGPLVESTRDQLKLSAPLTAITAAVVGVVLNLAVFFAYHLLWPQSLEGPFDVASAVVAVVAGVLLMRFKLSVMQVLGLCALAGLALRALGYLG